MLNQKNQTQIALVYFILAAGLGVLLRSFALFEIPINYRFIVHTHSHIVLLGWVYVALTTLIYNMIQSPKTHRNYHYIFWFTQFTLIGMLLTFPFQGYALFSIIFSTLFLFASYSFFWFFKKHAKEDFKKSNSYQCINAALCYMVVSSLGPWSLGIIMNTLGAESIWYRISIYFYLHFQYNGWMIMALFGLLFYVFEQSELNIPDKFFKTFLWSINLSIIFTFFLSTLWTWSNSIFYILGGLGSVIQGIALVYAINICKNHYQKLKSLLSKLQYNLLLIVFTFLVVKMLLQLLTVFPYFSNLASTQLDFPIGYLHWTFLGVVTMSIFLFLDYFKFIKLRKTSIILYLIGFMATEVLIFYKGIAGWLSFPIFGGYSILLSIVSLIIVLAIIYILFTGFSGKSKSVIKA